MALGETARLLASLDLKDGLTPVVKTMSGSLDKLDTRIGKSSTRAYRVGQQVGTGIKAGAVIAVGAVTGLAALSIELAKEGQDAANVQTKYATAIANSGKVSADYVQILNAQQDAILNLTGADDELVKSQQTTLITMGLTGKQIATVIPLIFDAAKATGKDVGDVTLAVGKAIQGNVAGLGRLGIVLPKAAKATKSAALATLEQQKAQLAVTKSVDESHGALTKSEKALYAQKKAALDAAIGQQKLTDAQKKGATGATSYDTVVGALTKRFKGVDEATSGSLDVRLKVFQERLANIREEAGQKLLPAMTKIVDVVGAKLVPAFGKFIDTILPVVISGLDKLSGFLEGGGAEAGISRFLDIAKTAAPIIQAAAEDTLTVIQTAVGLFQSLPPEIQALAVAGLTINKLTGGLVTNIAGGLISAVISSFKGLMNVNAAVVNVNGPVGGLGALPGGLAGAGGAGALGVIGTAGIIAAAGVGSAYAFSQLASGPQAGPGAFTPTIGGAFAPKSVAASDFEKINWGKIAADLEASGRVPPGTTNVGDHSTDASEKAQQARNTAFNSNPTRADLRHQIAEDKRNLEGATGKNAVAIGRHLQSLQNRLDNRIATSNARVADAMAEAKRAIVTAIELSAPVINVPVTTQTLIDGRLVSANFSRYTSVIGGKVVNGTSGSGV